jgi:hypothetical protein
MSNLLPKLIMTREQFFEIEYLTAKCPQEISGMGTILLTANGDYRLEQLFLIEQEVSSAATDINAQALSKCLYEARNCLGQLSFWWHSHVNMTALFSSQDKLTIQEHARNGYMLGMVINKRGEYQIGLGLSQPKLYIDSGIELEIVENISPDLTAKLDKEFLEKVKEKTYATFTGYESPHYGKSNVWGENYDDDEEYVNHWNEKATYPAYSDKKSLHDEKPFTDERKNLSIKEETKILIAEFQKLKSKDLQELRKLYQDYNGDICNDIEDLEDFYVEYSLLMGNI